MAAANEEGPAGEGEAFENTTHPNEEEKTMNTTTVREHIRPIYGPSDIRADELADYFERHPSVLRDIRAWEDSKPTERGVWHARYVLGDHTANFFTEVVYPDFPKIKGPTWATRSEDFGIDPDTDFPMWAWYRELDQGDAMASSIQLVAKYDPETKVVLWSAPVLIVWVDGDTQIVFEAPEKAWQLRSVLHNAAHAFEQALEAQR